jgi:anion-transporting  ArsA/GET3 family ATPase
MSISKDDTSTREAQTPRAHKAGRALRALQDGGLAARPLDVDALIDDPGTRIIVCCGSGGVGKTTTAAALGVRAAERGRRVVVLTIDPARRLAQSMGLSQLDNTPRPVKGVDEAAGGELSAMMLDMKRTFDEVVLAHSDPERARQILENPFYQSLSAGFAGTQEYMAMEKLSQLRAADVWDLIVVDTPPSRSALDFLDAPNRLGSFLDGRFIRVLMAPAKVGGRNAMKFLNVGMSLVTGVLNKVIGAHVLTDVQTFVAALDSMFGGFRERADRTYKLLQAPGTAFLVVASPERDALREAAYFVDRLAADRMPLAGLVLNRVHTTGAPQLTAERALAAAETLEENGSTSNGSTSNGAADNGAADNGSAGNGLGESDGLGEAVAAGLLRLHAERVQVIARERRTRDRFVSVYPDVAITEVPALPGDVHDLNGLREIGAQLSNSPAAEEQKSAS